MDKDRRIRFLIPPLIFIASLLIGFGFDDDKAIQDYIGGNGKNADSAIKILTQLIALIASGGAVVVASGFLLQSITVLLLRIGFVVFGSQHNRREVRLSGSAPERILKKVRAPKGTQDIYFAIITFDHHLMRERKPGVHEWSIRRWNIYNASATSAVAVLLSLVVGDSFLGLELGTNWSVIATLVVLVFVLEAIFAWKDAMRMVEFQASLPMPFSKNSGRSIK